MACRCAGAGRANSRLPAVFLLLWAVLQRCTAGAVNYTFPPDYGVAHCRLTRVWSSRLLLCAAHLRRAQPL